MIGWWQIDHANCHITNLNNTIVDNPNPNLQGLTVIAKWWQQMVPSHMYVFI